MDKCVNERNQISFDCKYHQGIQPQLLSLSNNPQENQEDIFLCNKCFNKSRYNQQKFEDYLFIDDLLSANEKTILSKWPPLKNQELLFRINALLEDESKCINHQKETVTEYFDSFKQEINQHIDHVKKQMLIQCDQIPELEEQFMKYYNKIAEKDKVKDLLLTPNLDNSQASTNMREMLELKNNENEQNEELLMKVYTPYYKQLSSFDRYTPNKLKEVIIKTIDSVNFFPNQANKQGSSSNPKDILNKIIQEMDLERIKDQQDIEFSSQQKFIIQLINNPFNFLTKEFIERITEISKYFKIFLEDLDIDNCTYSKKVPINCDQLRIEQVELVEKLVYKMKEVEYSDNLQNSIIESLPNTKIILSHLNKQAVDFEQIQLMLQHYPILELLKIDFNFIKSFFQQSQTNLDMKRLENGSVSFTKKNFDGYDNIILSKQYLEKNKTYKIQFKIEPSNTSKFYYLIGLTSKESTKQLNQQNLCLKLNHIGSERGQGMDKLKKGNLDNFSNFKQFELVMNLSKGLLQLADFPEYNNITEIDDDKKEQLSSNSPFQIGFSIHYQRDILHIQNIQVINE